MNDRVENELPDASDWPDPRPSLAAWVRCDSLSQWHEQVRGPSEVYRAIGLAKDRLDLPFREALAYVVGQGTVIPISPEQAIADLARFFELLETLPAAYPKTEVEA